MVGPEGRIDTKANHVTPSGVSKDVADLLLNERIVFAFPVSHVGQLKARVE